MAWNITKTDKYKEVFEREFARKMRSASYRDRYLTDAALAEDEETIGMFAKAAAHCAETKSLRVVESFFNQLLSDGRFEVHKRCMQMLADELMKRPANIVKYFTTDKLKYRKPQSNPLVSKDDDFGLICTYFIFQPALLLTDHHVLGETFTKEIEKSSNGNITFATLSLIGYRAYSYFSNSACIHKPSVESSCDEINDCLRKGCGDDSREDLLRRIAVPTKEESLLRRYLRHFEDFHVSRYPLCLSMVASNVACWYPFSFMLSMRFNLPELISDLKDRIGGGYDYNRMMEEVAKCELSSPKTIRRYFSEKWINQENIDLLVEKGHMKHVLRHMTAERIAALAEREIVIPPDIAPKQILRKQISRDLGL